MTHLNRKTGISDSPVKLVRGRFKAEVTDRTINSSISFITRTYTGIAPRIPGTPGIQARSACSNFRFAAIKPILLFKNKKIGFMAPVLS